MIRIAQALLLAVSILLLAYSIWGTGKRLEGPLKRLSRTCFCECECAPCPGEQL